MLLRNTWKGDKACPNPKNKKKATAVASVIRVGFPSFSPRPPRIYTLAEISMCNSVEHGKETLLCSAGFLCQLYEPDEAMWVLGFGRSAEREFWIICCIIGCVLDLLVCDSPPPPRKWSKQHIRLGGREEGHSNLPRFLPAAAGRQTTGLLLHFSN